MAELKKAAIVAAKWWTEKISHPTLDDFNNGDRTSDSSFFIMILAHMDALEHAATKEQLNKFSERLAQKISDELDSKDELYLDCDYGPCAVLGEIAEEVRIDISLFPYKRAMWVSPESVKIKDGYGAPIKSVYPE